MLAHMLRVRQGDYYSDGRRLVEVLDVGVQGFVRLRDCADETTFGCAMAAFRLEWWPVRESGERLTA
jgi:hypothetical protein